jgi:glycosyltransferase involved in cell wall biosynthesis
MTIPSVCHIITKLELGGAQQNTLFTVSHLDRKRYRPMLVSGESGILDREAQDLLGEHFYRVPYLVREISPLKDLLAIRDLTRLLNRLKPLIVHTHSSKAGIIGRLAARLAGVPIIIHTIHGFGFTPYQQSLHRWMLVAAERWIGRVTTRFFAVSEANRLEGVKRRLFQGDQCAIVRSGVDLAAIQRMAIDTRAKKRELGFDTAQLLVGMIAPMKKQKAPLDFIRAAALIRATRPDVRFVFIGDGDLRPAVEAEASRLGLSESLQLPGWRRDALEILRCLDVFVLTSLWEGLPRVYVEARASGIPVVGTRVDGAEEVIRDGEHGYLLDPGDVSGMADRVLRLLNDVQLRNAMGQRAATGIPVEFDIHHMVSLQEQEYERLLASLPDDSRQGRLTTVPVPNSKDREAMAGVKKGRQ